MQRAQRGSDADHDAVDDDHGIVDAFAVAAGVREPQLVADDRQRERWPAPGTDGPDVRTEQRFDECVHVRSPVRHPTTANGSQDVVSLG